MKIAALLLSVFVIGPAWADDQQGTPDNPLILTCENLQQVIDASHDRTDGPIIAGTMSIEAEDDGLVPPIMLGCKGDVHIVCVMELPSSLEIGTTVRIQGRMSKIGENYAAVDPCGVAKVDP